MNKRVAQYLSHAENRIHICCANRLLWEAKGDTQSAEEASRSVYKWIGIAQEQHQEDHF
jgi:hypothetical protein